VGTVGRRQWRNGGALDGTSQKEQWRRSDCDEGRSKDRSQNDSKAGDEACHWWDSIIGDQENAWAPAPFNQGNNPTDSGNGRIMPSAGPISPAPTARTPLATFGGWDLVLHCVSCGPRTRSVLELIVVVGGGHQELGHILPKLLCPTCRTRPQSISSTSVWQTKYGRDPLSIDLTEFIASKIAA
jgi:hypothetical protein